ncbi:acyl-CoA dehydrogenase family protein [Gordonia sinesedis]
MTESTTLDSVSAEEREALRASVREVLARRAGSASVRSAMGATPRIDAGLWRTLCADVGVAALPVPVDLGGVETGGAGATLAEAAVVLEELGAALAPVPALAHALATAAVLIADDAETVGALLPDLAAGSRTATVCWASERGWSAPGVTADAGLLSGAAHHVLDAESADVLLVLATSGDSLTLHRVDADTEGVDIRPRPVLDPTRPLSTVVFDDVAATAIAAPDDLYSRLLATAWALVSAEQVGGARRSLELSVEYASARTQFGRPIGSFQALKHRMADMYTLVETATSMSRAAVDAVASGDRDAVDIASAAHVYCSDAFRSVAGDAIQIHGGIGITWEHDIQLYFKRAQSSSQLFGQPHEIVARLARDAFGSAAD